MTKNNPYVAIMAGGIGSRFWPKSRAEYPKQFLDILQVGKSLLQITYDRFVDICPPENIFIVTSHAYIPLIKKQFPTINEKQIVAEPCRKNTAPCILYIANKIAHLNSQATLIVTPSDHLILQETLFKSTIETAINIASQKNILLTLGINPTRPDTGYGYIQYAKKIKKDGSYKVKKFTEKPSKEVAELFLKDGKYLWNAGIFIWSVQSILSAFKKYQKKLYTLFDSSLYNSPKEAKFIESIFTHCPDISIDYAIIEKANNVHVVPASFTWSDIGTWASLYAIAEKDINGNTTYNALHQFYDAHNNLVQGNKNKLIVVQGVSDCCIIDTDDVLLVCKTSSEQKVKNITTTLKKAKKDIYL